MAVFKDSKRKTWFYQVTFRDDNGVKRFKKKRGFKLKAEAEMAEKMFLLSAQDQHAKHLTLKEACTHFLDYKKSRLRITSYKSLEPKIRLHILSFFGDTDIKKIDAKRCLAFQNYLESLGHSAKFTNKVVALLGSILKHVDKYLMPIANHTNKLETIRSTEGKKEMLFWTLEEFKAFISTFDNDSVYRTLFYTLYWTGLRIGEALALTWQDIDLETREVKVTKTLTNKAGTGTYLISPPKTKGSKRTVPIGNSLVEVLKERLVISKKVDGFDPSWFIFGSDKPAQATSIDRIKKQHCELSGVKWIRNHDFRHSHASVLINNGADILLVSKRLGHTNIAMTLNIYSHLYPNKERELADKIDELA